MGFKSGDSLGDFLVKVRVFALFRALFRALSSFKKALSDFLHVPLHLGTGNTKMGKEVGR